MILQILQLYGFRLILSKRQPFGVVLLRRATPYVRETNYLCACLTMESKTYEHGISLGTIARLGPGNKNCVVAAKSYLSPRALWTSSAARELTMH